MSEKPPYSPTKDFSLMTGSSILLLFFFVTACVTATSQLGYLFMFLNNMITVIPIFFLAYLLFLNNATINNTDGKLFIVSVILCAVCWLFELITSIIYMVIFIKMRFLKFSTLQRKNIFRNTRIFIAEWIFYILACGVLLFFIAQNTNGKKQTSPNSTLFLVYLFGIIAFILASIRMGLTVELLDNVKRTTLRHEPVGTCTNDSSIPT